MFYIFYANILVQSYSTNHNHHGAESETLIYFLVLYDSGPQTLSSSRAVDLKEQVWEPLYYMKEF